MKTEIPVFSSKQQRHRRTTSTSSVTGTNAGTNAANLRRNENKKAGVVTVFDVSSLLPFNRTLAEAYTYNVSSRNLRKDVCKENAALAAANHCDEIKGIWSVAAILAEYFERHEANILMATNQHRHSSNSNALIGAYGDRPHEYGKGQLDIGSNVSCSTYIPHYYEDEEEVEDFHWLQFHPLGEDLLHEM